MIPKIIHQIWWQGENNIPKTYPDYRSSWKNKNKDFNYIFWDQNTIEKLVDNYFPFIKNKFNSLSKMIQKIDIAKYMILYHYGGIYVDIDSECLKPINNLIKTFDKKKILLTEFNLNPLEKLLAFGKTKGVVVQNGFMGSTRSHTFWLHCLKVFENEDMNKKKYETQLKYIFRTTGPGLLTESYHSYPNKNDITILSSELVDPISWCNYEVYKCTTVDCSKFFPKAYTIHHFGSKHNTHNWTGNIEKKIGLTFCRYIYKYKYYWILFLCTTLILFIFMIIKKIKKTKK